MKSVLFILIFVYLYKQYNGHGEYALIGEACIQCSRCNLIRGDVFREVNKPYIEHYNNANIELKKHIQLQYCNPDEPMYKRITGNCRRRQHECEKQLKNDLVIELNISRELLHERGCSYTGYPYLIFLCKWVQHWPRNVTDYYNPTDVMKSVCDESCYRIKRFYEFNIKRGKKIPADFPPDWDERQKQHD